MEYNSDDQDQAVGFGARRCKHVGFGTQQDRQHKENELEQKEKDDEDEEEEEEGDSIDNDNEDDEEDEDENEGGEEPEEEEEEEEREWKEKESQYMMRHMYDIVSSPSKKLNEQTQEEKELEEVLAQATSFAAAAAAAASQDPAQTANPPAAAADNESTAANAPSTVLQPPSTPISITPTTTPTIHQQQQQGGSSVVAQDKNKENEDNNDTNHDDDEDGDNNDTTTKTQTATTSTSTSTSSSTTDTPPKPKRGGKRGPYNTPKKQWLQQQHQRQQEEQSRLQDEKQLSYYDAMEEIYQHRKQMGLAMEAEHVAAQARYEERERILWSRQNLWKGTTTAAAAALSSTTAAAHDDDDGNTQNDDNDDNIDDDDDDNTDDDDMEENSDNDSDNDNDDNDNNTTKKKKKKKKNHPRKKPRISNRGRPSKKQLLDEKKQQELKQRELEERIKNMPKVKPVPPEVLDRTYDVPTKDPTWYKNYLRLLKLRIYPYRTIEATRQWIIGTARTKKKERDLVPWVKQQRLMYKFFHDRVPSSSEPTNTMGKLVRGKINMLSQLHFVWNYKVQTPPTLLLTDVVEWRDQFKQLKEYVNTRGDSYVPTTSSLGLWCLNQRMQYNNGQLAKDRHDTLSNLGFDFRLPSPLTDWGDMFVKLTVFKSRHGDCLIAPPEEWWDGKTSWEELVGDGDDEEREEKKNDWLLRLWCQRQRFEYRLFKEYEKWRKKEKEKEKEQQQQQQQQQQEEGEEGVVASSTAEEEPNKEEKDNHSDENDTDDEDAKEDGDDEEGSDDEEHDEDDDDDNDEEKQTTSKTTRKKQKKKKKKKKNTTTSTSSSNPTREKVPVKPMITQSQIDALNNLGFIWSREISGWWINRYRWLKSYQAEHGTCLVPRDPEKKNDLHPLGVFVFSLRRKHRLRNNRGREKNNLVPEKVKLLNDINFEWEVPDQAPVLGFDKRYEMLKEFHREHGHCLVPQNHPTLGDFVKRMRRWYVFRERGVKEGRNLTDEKKRKLEALDFCWRIRERASPGMGRKKKRGKGVAGGGGGGGKAAAAPSAGNENGVKNDVQQKPAVKEEEEKKRKRAEDESHDEEFGEDFNSVEEGEEEEGEEEDEEDDDNKFGGYGSPEIAEDVQAEQFADVEVMEDPMKSIIMATSTTSHSRKMPINSGKQSKPNHWDGTGRKNNTVAQTVDHHSFSHSEPFMAQQQQATFEMANNAVHHVMQGYAQAQQQKEAQQLQPHQHQHESWSHGNNSWHDQYLQQQQQQQQQQLTPYHDTTTTSRHQPLSMSNANSLSGAARNSRSSISRASDLHLQHHSRGLSTVSNSINTYDLTDVGGVNDSASTVAAQRSIAQDLKCPLCTGIQVRSTCCIPCGHSYCESCVEHICNSMGRICPKCNGYVTETVWQRHVDGLIFQAVDRGGGFTDMEVEMFMRRSGLHSVVSGGGGVVQQQRADLQQIGSGRFYDPSLI